MKRIFTSAALLLCVIFSIRLNAQYCGNSGPHICTPNSSITTPGFYPPEDSLPCAVVGIPYTQIIEFRSPTAAAGYNIKSIKIDSITNLPCGFCWALNDTNNTITPANTACIKVSGTTYDAPGQYLIKIYADVTVYIFGTITATINNVYVDSVANLKYFARVQLPGDTCIHIDTLSKGLTASKHGTIPTPTITAGAAIICPGSSTTLTVTGGNYYGYVWSNGTFSSSTTVSAAGTYTVTVYYDCTSATASKTIAAYTVTPPTITPTGPTTFCQGGNVTLNSSAASGYHWSTNATTSGITVSTGGSYTVTITDAHSCTVGSTATVVTVNPNPSATITPGGPTTFCAGGNVTLSAPAGLTYNWSNSTSGQSINVTTGGSYTVTVTNSNNCSAVSAATVVTVSPLPNDTVTANGPLAFCNGGNVILSAAAGLSYSWSNSSTAQSITVTTGNTYTVTVSNAHCSAVSTPTIVTVYANPNNTVTPNGPLTFCTGGNVTLNAAAGLTYNWSNSTSGQSITVSTSGSYTVTVSNTHCSAVSAPAVVTVNALPNDTITANGPLAFCNGGNVTLSAAAGLTYHWSNSSTAQSIIVNSGNNYTVTVSNTNCSAVSAPTVVTVYNNPANTVTTSGSLTFCPGDSVTLSAVAGLTYAWSNSTSGQSITVKTAGSYTVTVSNTHCSAVSAPEVVSLNALPDNIVTANDTTTFCSGDSVTLTAAAGLTYHWSNSTSGQSITVSTSGIYTVTVTNGSNCTAVSTPITVTVNANPQVQITANGATTFCSGNNLSLSATAGLTYLWSTTAITQIITVTQSGTYIVTGTDVNGCSAASPGLPITVLPATSISTQPVGQGTCIGGNVTFSVTAVGSSLTYQWVHNGGNIAGALSSSYNIAAAAFADTGRYTVIVSGDCGKDTSQIAVLSVTGSLTFSQQPVSQNACVGNPVTFTTVANGANAAFQWKKNNVNINGAQSSSYTINAVALSDTGSYTCFVTSSCGNGSSNAARLTVNSPTATSYSHTICAGNSYNFNGQNLTVANTYVDTLTGTNGCDSIVTLTLIVNQPTATTINAVICAGHSYNFNGQNLTVANTYKDTLTGANNCDSIVTLNLTVNQPSATTINASICAGHTYTFNGQSLSVANTYVDTMQGSNTCDSIVTLNLTVIQSATQTINASICAGQVYTFNGQSLTVANIYVDTLQGSNACDSIVTLNLSVNQPTAATINAAICAGSSYYFNGQNITAAGTYVDTLQGSNTCDSIVTLTLTINQPLSSTINTSVCTGGTYDFNGQSLTAAGTYTDTIFTHGCDSIVTLNLSISPPVTTTVNEYLCYGGTYFFYGRNLSVAGTYTDTLHTGSGCDSVIVLNLAINPIIQTIVNAGICSGSTYSFFGTQLTTTGVYRDTVITGNGCDSVVELHLQVDSIIMLNLSAAICNGSSYVFGARILTSAGTYSDTSTAIGGCDSITTLSLIVNPIADTIINATICAGHAYDFNGQSLTAAGTYQDLLTSVNGCDSVVTLHLSVNQPDTLFTRGAICIGGTYNFNGQQLTASGTYHATLTGANGCDSVVILILQVSTVIQVPLNVTTCAPSYAFNGQNLTQSGTYADTLQAQGGCDSITTLTLIINHPSSSAYNYSICAGNIYDFNGQSVTAAGTYTDTLQNAAGCDSVVTLTLTVNQASFSTISRSVCTGESFNFNGQILSAAGTYTDTLQNAHSCDSIVTLTLTLLPVPTVTWPGSDTLCNDGVHPISISGGAPAGGSYSGTGVTGNVLNPVGAGPYVITYTFTDGNGCSDSINKTFVINTCTSIDELNMESSIHMYPNPANDMLMVESQLFTNHNMTPVLFDVTGKEINAPYTLQGNKFTFNTSGLAEGLYWLKLTINGSSVSKRFVKM